MIVIGLTGSIGMGKSTIAAMLEQLKIPVHEADAEVHRLLASKGRGFRAVAAAFPYFKFPQIYGKRNKAYYLKRSEMGKIIFADDKARKKLEKILHPLVQDAQNQFIRKAKRAGHKIVALDIPLLFEIGGEKRVDVTLVASSPFAVQRARVLARPGMTEKKFRAILKRQMPDGEKRARADYVIPTGIGRAHTMKELKAVIRKIKESQDLK